MRHLSKALRAEVRAAEIKLTDEPNPFGLRNGEWRDLVSSIQDGDELWQFSSSKERWSRLTGRAGMALVRSGKIVEYLITVMN